MTRRLLTAVVVLGLVFGGVGSAEAKPTGRSTRTIYGRYGPYPSPVTGCNDPLGPWACMPTFELQFDTTVVPVDEIAGAVVARLVS